MTVAMKVKKTIADLKGAKATIKLYSMQAQPKDSRDTYNEATEILSQIIMDLENRVKTMEIEEPQYKGF